MLKRYIGWALENLSSQHGSDTQLSIGWAGCFASVSPRVNSPLVQKDDILIYITTLFDPEFLPPGIHPKR